MLALEHCSSIYRRQLFFVLFLFFFYGRLQEIIISRHNNKNVYKRTLAYSEFFRRRQR